ncbi:MAG: peroxidase family protein [Bacteriovoracia bacterium]
MKYFFLLLLTFSALSFGALEYPSPWTDWYRHSLVKALLKLRQMRVNLEKRNLHDPHIAFPANVKCNPETRLVRTLDGTCNDLNQTMMGARGVRFGRNIPLEFGHSIEDEILNPDPRLISRELLTRNEFRPVPFLNLLAASWIQFMTHDWFSHGKNEEVDPFFLPLHANDPFKQKDMMVLRTKFDRTRSERDKVLPVTFTNEVTHWWDGSQVYGSDIETSNKLRTFKDGLLKVNEKGLLPTDSDGIELAGFKDNWWVGLSLMHHLFTLEHNAIAKHLKNAHPGWNDEKLFHTARMVNAALIAKIHTIEWTPAILPNKHLGIAMNANWKGLANPTGNVRWPLEIIKDPVLSGLVGGKRNIHGTAFSMTEEFVSVYRMHPLLPESFDVRSLETGKLEKTIPLANTRNEESPKILARHSLEDLFYSFGISHPGQLVLNNYPEFLQEIELPIMGKVDLAAIDLIRDRERGVPRYNQFRRLVGLKPVRSFDDLTPDKKIVQKLKAVYQGDIEKLDLMIGSFAEAYRPTNFGFGETSFQIFILMASRRLQGDRFYTEDYTPEVYSKEGLKWIDRGTMKDVLLRHMPQLKSKLTGVENAFNPWNK